MAEQRRSNYYEKLSNSRIYEKSKLVYVWYLTGVGYKVQPLVYNMSAMNYSVYILHSRKDQRLYVGCTSNLSERLKRHRKGEVAATKFRRPLELIHSEVFASKADAFNRERFLKSLWGAREKKKILNEFINGLKYSA